MPSSSEERTYEITFEDGTRRRITIPETWKVTFGAVVPGKPGSAMSGPHGIRIWEGTDKQRAVYARVVSFRDLSIPTQIAAVRRFGTEDDQWFPDDGSWIGERAGAVEKAWRNEDDVMAEDPQKKLAENLPKW